MTLDSYSVALMQSDNLIIKESIDQHLLTEKQPNPPEIQILGTTSDPDLAGKSVKMKKSGTDSDGLFRKASLLLPSGIKHSRSSDSISIMSVDSRASNMVR